jgi:hypothetical protein
VISYLVARPNQRDLVVAAHQQITREWWANRRHEFTLFASAVVIEEALRGDPEYAKARMEVVEQLRLADVTRAARALAAQLLLEAALPPKANADALHISIAAVNGIDNLLTWKLHAPCKCRHSSARQRDLSCRWLRAAVRFNTRRTHGRLTACGKTPS